MRPLGAVRGGDGVIDGEAEFEDQKIGKSGADLRSCRIADGTGRALRRSDETGPSAMAEIFSSASRPAQEFATGIMMPAGPPAM